MKKLLIKNIRFLAGAWQEDPGLLRGRDMQELPVLEDAWVAVEDGKIADFGLMSDGLGISDWNDLEVIDATGKAVLPTWVDSHTHLIFAADREDEFADRLRGLSYQQIAERGGGILNSARKLAAASEDELFDGAMRRLEELIRMGTGAIEIKSGYGLTTEAELKMLRVATRIQQTTLIPVKRTFLGAHAFPEAYRDQPEKYVDLIVEEMIPAVACEGLADYVDAFCEKGYFTLDQTRRVLEAGAAHGMKAKVHVNQFNSFGAVRMCADLDALSVDHLEEMTDDDLNTLREHPGMIPVALPGCSLFLSIPYTPGRNIIDNGLALALASDYNPGSAPSGNMNLVVSLASIKMKLLPEEAIAAATINGAYAMEIQDIAGSITPGKMANLIITKQIPSLAYLSYAFGSNHIEEVLICGEKHTR